MCGAHTGLFSRTWSTLLFDGKFWSEMQSSVIYIRKWNSFNNDLFCGSLLYGTDSRNSLWGENCLTIHMEVTEIGGKKEPQSGRAACEQAVRARVGSVSSLFISSFSFPPILYVRVF